MAKPSLEALLNKSKKIKDISSPRVAPVPVEAPEPTQALTQKEYGKATIYYVEFNDGTAMLARGEHADIVFRFTKEAQEIASNDGTLYYEGPELERMSKAKALDLIGVTS